MPSILTSRRGAQGLRPQGPFTLNSACSRARGLSYGNANWYQPTGNALRDYFPSAQYPASTGTAIGCTPAFGAAVAIPGSGGVDLGSVGTVINGANSFTVAVWYQPTTLGTSRRVVQNWDAGAGGWLLSHDDSTSSALIMAVVDGGSGRSISVTSAGVLTAGSPVRLVMTWAGGAIKLAANGVQLSVSAPETAAASGVRTTTGATQVGTGVASVDGLIGEVLLMRNRVWTDVEIWADYAAQTRWELYQVPSTRVYVDVPAAGGAFNPAWAVSSSRIYGGVTL